MNDDFRHAQLYLLRFEVFVSAATEISLPTTDLVTRWLLTEPQGCVPFLFAGGRHTGRLDSIGMFGAFDADRGFCNVLACAR